MADNVKKTQLCLMQRVPNSVCQYEM